MERDLALIRTMRAKREQEAQALEAAKSAKELEDRLGEKSGDLAFPAFRLDETGNAEPEDAIMVDQPANQRSNLYDSPNSKDEDVPSSRGPEKSVPASEDIGGSKGLVMSIDTRPKEKAPFSPTAIKRQNTADTIDQNLETPSTANLRDMEFETMFNDTENSGSGSGIELNFSFAPTSSMEQGPLNESSQSVGLSNKEPTNPLTLNENNGIPNFGNYVNTGQEFSMTGIPSSSKIPSTGSHANKIAASSAVQDSGTTETPLDNIYKYSHNFATAPENYDMGGEDIMDMADLDEWLQ